MSFALLAKLGLLMHKRALSAQAAQESGPNRRREGVLLRGKSQCGPEVVIFFLRGLVMLKRDRKRSVNRTNRSVEGREVPNANAKIGY